MSTKTSTIVLKALGVGYFGACAGLGSIAGFANGIMACATGCSDTKSVLIIGASTAFGIPVGIIGGIVMPPIYVYRKLNG